MNTTNYKNGEEISQKLFELTGDIRYHNMRVGFENLRKEKEREIAEEEMMGREM